jgi:siroheme synthase (precorrin-2 oxidase/ferrochelatase)
MKDKIEDHAMACEAVATKSEKREVCNVLVGLMVSRGDSIFSVTTVGSSYFLCGRHGCRQAREIVC